MAARRYSTAGMGSADASFAPTTPGRAAKRMPESLMALKKESNSRKYDIGVLATPGRKKLPVLAGGLAGSMAGSKAPAFCTPTRQRTDAAGINRQRRQTMSTSKPMAINLDDSDPSLDDDDDDDERPPDLRRGLRGGRRGLAAKGTSPSERRLSLSLTKGAPSNRKLMGRSKSHDLGGLDSKSDHVSRHSFSRPSSDHEPQQLSRIRRRMSLGGPMQRPSNDYGTSKYTESTGPAYVADVDVDDDISIDDTVGDGNHNIAVTHIPRGSVKNRNSLLCTMPNRADILPAPSTPGKKATRPNLGEHGKSPSRRVPKLPEKKSPTKRDDKKDPNKNIVAEIGSPSKRAPKQSSLEKTSPTKRENKKGPNKNIVAEIDAMDISAISVDADLDLGYGDDTEEDPDAKRKLPRRSKSTGSAGSNGKIKARISAIQHNNTKQGTSQNSPTDVEETKVLTEGGLETNQVATEAPVPSKQALAPSSSHQEVIAVEVSPVICDGGPVVLRPASTTWLCTCGHTSDKSDRHCGMCGTKQLWTCIDCMYTENLCIYSFCTACGTKKMNFLEQANAQAKPDPSAPCSPSSVMGTP